MKKGFSLPEVITVSLMIALVGGLLLALMINNAGLFYQQSSKVSQGVGLNDSLAEIRSDIKQAIAIASQYPVSGSSQYTSSSTQLVLKFPGIDASGNIITNVFDYVVFFTENNKVKIKIFPDSLSQRKPQDRILSGNVSSLLFEYFDSTGQTTSPSSAVKVKITIKLQTNTGSIKENSVASSEAKLRND